MNSPGHSSHEGRQRKHATAFRPSERTQDAYRTAVAEVMDELDEWTEHVEALRAKRSELSLGDPTAFDANKRQILDAQDYIEDLGLVRDRLLDEIPRLQDRDVIDVHDGKRARVQSAWENVRRRLRDEYPALAGQIVEIAHDYNRALAASEELRVYRIKHQKVIPNEPSRSDDGLGLSVSLSLLSWPGGGTIQVQNFANALKLPGLSSELAASTSVPYLWPIAMERAKPSKSPEEHEAENKARFRDLPRTSNPELGGPPMAYPRNWRTS